MKKKKRVLPKEKKKKVIDIYNEDQQNGTLQVIVFNKDGTLKVHSFSIYYREEDEINLQTGWPVVESALEEHDISCELNLVEDFMTVSTTKKTGSFERARHLLKLLSVGFPLHRAINILNDKMQCEVIEAYPPEDGRTCGECGTCEECGIKEEEFCEWVDRLAGPRNSTIKALCRLTECEIFISGFTVSAIGPFQGINAIRNIVLGCIKDKHSPRSHASRLRKNQAGLKEIVEKLENQTGITSIMEAVRFMKTQIICRELIYTKFMEALHRIQDTDVLEMIADKFSSSDSPEVHGDAAETLCAISRFAPPGISTKISSPSFIRTLFWYALEDSRPKSVLVNSLSVCISLLDPRRVTLGAYEHMYGCQITHGSRVTGNPETVVGMLEVLGGLLKLLDVSSVDNVLLTTYGKLHPPLGKHRLKILEFISVLLKVGGEAVEKELIRLGAVQRILDLFFKYPFNNSAHHHIENIIVSCLKSKNASLVQHLLCECDLVGKILKAEKNFIWAAHSNKPTIPAEGRSPPRMGNIGHFTCISNKIIKLGYSNSNIQAILQENCEWTDWRANFLSKCNSLKNVRACGGTYSGKRRREQEIQSGNQTHSIQSSPPSSPLPRPSQKLRPTLIITGTDYGWHVKI